jgi:translocation and assembly module TamB
VTLDVGLEAPGQVFLRGRGLNAEFALDARVEGTLAAPRLTGVARVVRGEWEFAGRRFEFDDDGRVILSMRPEAVRLDLRAVREDPNLTAVVRVQGTAAAPLVTLTSTPALPQDEILAQVLFGRSSARLSAVEAAQVAAAVAALAGGGGFDVLGGLRELAGLDRLSFGSDAAGVTVAGGKYLSDDIYIEIIGGGQQGSAVQVEWRARKNVSVLSRITGQGAARLSVRWRREVR